MTGRRWFIFTTALFLCAGCAGSSASSSGTSNPLAAVSPLAQSRAQRFLSDTLPLLETTTTKDADEYLAAAHTCAASDTTQDRATFRRCTQAAIAGTEAMDGPPLRDPLVAWRIAEQDLGDVFAGILDAKLVAGACRAAIAADVDATVNAYDRVISKIQSAVSHGQFGTVSSLSAPAPIAALDASAANAGAAWQSACHT